MRIAPHVTNVTIKFRIVPQYRFKALRGQIITYRNRLRNAMYHAMRGYAVTTDAVIKYILSGQTPMLHKRSGRLYAGQYYRVVWGPGKNTVIADFYNVDPVAPILHYGTVSSYFIRPRGKGRSWVDIRGRQWPGADWLRFIWHGKIIFAQKVLHPKMPKRRFILDSMYATVPELGNLFRDAISAHVMHTP